MIRRELVQRKLQLIVDDLGQLLEFKEDSLEALKSDAIRLAAVERLIERIVMRAIDINEHLISELWSGDGKTTRLTYRDTFVMLADIGVYSRQFAEQIADSAGLRNILVHDYNDADRRIVHAAIVSCLRDYYDYVESIRAYLTRVE